MKRDKWLACPIAAVLSFLLSFAGVMCLQSAFGLEANVRHVALGCAISAVAFSLGYTVKFWYIPLLVLAPVAGWLWQKGSLARSVEWLLYRLSATYDQAYNCGVLYWSDAIPTAGDATMALCAIGCLVALVSAWTVCRKKPALFAVLTALLPLATCFVVTDRVPQTRYLFWLLLGILVLLLSQLTRRKDVKKGNILTLLVTVPAAIGLLILFWAVPQDTYRGQERADRILQTVETWIEELSGRGTPGTSTGLDQTVELDQIGRLVQTHTPVMTVSVRSSNSSDHSKTETIYLRQQGFQMYDGTSWYNEYGNNIYQWIQWDRLQQSGQVNITTRKLQLMKFVPYYAKELIDPPEGPNFEQDITVDSFGITENLQKAYGYTYYFYQLKSDAPSALIEKSTGGIQLPVGSYSPDAISLPADTVAWAEEVVAPLIEGKATVKTRAEAIGNYVRNLAEYSRNTGRMPVNKTDFAKWFVEDADTGYCVHFATTAAVLLRAAGIQAQYVEGYVARASLYGTAVTVYEDQAHAWVEYYDPAVGWRILESTPSEGVPSYDNTPQPGTPTPPQTQPTPTQPQPTQPGQSGEQAKSAWKGLWWVLGIVGAVLVILAQWRIRLRLEKYVLAKGTVNVRAVKLWRRIARLSRLMKQRPAPELFQLAQKAKFSQHVLTEAELAQLTDALDACHRALKAKPWYCQPVYTVILAVY